MTPSKARVRDVVSCGAGRDLAAVDRKDIVRDDCERAQLSSVRLGRDPYFYGAQALLPVFIHQSAWKVDPTNFALAEVMIRWSTDVSTVYERDRSGGRLSLTRALSGRDSEHA